MNEPTKEKISVLEQEKYLISWDEAVRFPEVQRMETISNQYYLRVFNKTYKLFQKLLTTLEQEVNFEKFEAILRSVHYLMSQYTKNDIGDENKLYHEEWMGYRKFSFYDELDPKGNSTIRNPLVAQAAIKETQALYEISPYQGREAPETPYTDNEQLKIFLEEGIEHEHFKLDQIRLRCFPSNMTPEEIDQLSDIEYDRFLDNTLYISALEDFDKRIKKIRQALKQKPLNFNISTFVNGRLFITFPVYIPYLLGFAHEYFEQIAASGSDEPLEDYLRKLSNYLQVIAICQPFVRNNLSTSMLMINYFLHTKNMKGVRHGILDFAACYLSQDDFASYFKAEVERAQNNL